MPTIQGEFATKDEAQRAVRALQAAGVSETHVRVWNIVGDSPPDRPSGYSATTTGAYAGALLGGLPGMALGATLGGAVDAATAGNSRLPPASGSRVVVEDPPAGLDVAAILRECGARNVG